MLRRIDNLQLIYQPTVVSVWRGAPRGPVIAIWGVRWWVTGHATGEEWAQFADMQRRAPLGLPTPWSTVVWCFGDRYYHDEDGVLTQQQVFALLFERWDRRRAKIE